MNVKSSIVAALLTVLFTQCTKPKQVEEAKVIDFPNEAHRPLVHFSPRIGWMNDPNGMYFRDGEYHLFFQFYPDSTVWGPMHWGHAVSKDLMHWEQLPIALAPDQLGYIFSGSVAVDDKNTSGLGTADIAPAVAIFTYHNDSLARTGSKEFQTQGLAFSLDHGRTWKKYEHNPVLKNPGIQDFRDPKVSWHDASKQWVMTLAVKDHIEFYGSPNLTSWKKLSEFGLNDGGHGGVWECPDLFALQDNDGKAKDILIVNINPGAPNGGSGTQYFTGHFDGTKFVSDTPGHEAGWLDYGTDEYAGVTFANVPDHRRVFLGWMSNWLYAQVVPTNPWRSAMTSPRDLKLRTIGGKAMVASSMAPEVASLVDSTAVVNPFHGAALALPDMHLERSLIKGSIRRSNFLFTLANGKDQQVTVRFDPSSKTFVINRSGAGNHSFYPEFSKTISAPRAIDNEWINFTMLLDQASMELFFDDGLTAATVIYFPDEPLNSITITSPSGSVETDTLTVQRLRTIW